GFSRDYRRIEEFHDGFYDKHNWVSPWTISACNVDSPIMIVGQDWASEEFLAGPANTRQQALGHDPDLPTNKNLKYLLREAFDRELSDVFATNAFVFVKLGGMGTRIPLKDLRRCVETYTLREVEIIRPKMLLCMGTHAFNAFRAALGHSYQPLNQARYSMPEVTFQETEIYGVPHVGARGLNSTGGRPKSLEIWLQLASRLSQL
ncbi:uracil-DNA glycosylase family protein, partial [Rhodoferax sp.]|uniref:uracil-DNA glycosylase family protein n=1 Tax=Rhodoferax sp. TaxID=50421 RepID=UPI0027597539|nr:uracil-DNA glycosylase family protein [Rhodoferax sp.]